MQISGTATCSVVESTAQATVGEARLKARRETHRMSVPNRRSSALIAEFPEALAALSVDVQATLRADCRNAEGADGWTLSSQQDLRSLDLDRIADAVADELDRSSGTSVALVWLSDNDGIKIRRELLASLFDELWYPASDDVVMRLDGDLSMLVVLDHEEVLSVFERA